MIEAADLCLGSAVLSHEHDQECFFFAVDVFPLYKISGRTLFLRCVAA